MQRPTALYRLHVYALIATVSVLAVACADNSDASVETSERVTVTLGNKGIEAPKALPVGLVSFAVSAPDGADEQQIQLFQLGADTDPPAFFKALGDGDIPGALKLSRPAGGINLAPGRTTELVVELDEARYVFLEPDSGVVSGVMVAAGESDDEALALDGVVSLKNFEISLPSGFGNGTYAVESTDEAVHGLTVIKLNEGVTLDEVRSLLATDADLPGVAVIRAGHLGPRERQIVTLDLPDGHYVAASYFPDLASGSTQASLGMVAEFTVGS